MTNPSTRRIALSHQGTQGDAQANQQLIDVTLMPVSGRLGRLVGKGDRPHPKPDAEALLLALEGRQEAIGLGKRIGQTEFDSMKIRRRAILASMRELETLNVDYDDFDLAAMIVKSTGGFEQAKPFILDARKMHDHGIIHMGGINNISQVVSDGIPQQVVQALDSQPSSKTVEELAELIEMDMGTPKKNRRATQLVNVSLNLADSLGLVCKLPMEAESGRWISNSLRQSPETIPTWMRAYRIMETLDQHPNIPILQVVDFGVQAGYVPSRPHMISERTRVPASTSHVEPSINNLYRYGLADYTMQRAGQIDTPHYSLTADGKRMLDETRTQGYLSEELRCSLLGTLQQGPSLSQMRMAAKIERWMDVRAAREEHPDSNRSQIGAQAGVSPSYVQNVEKGVRPWRNATEETLRAYVPLLDPSKRDAFTALLDEEFKKET